MTTLKELREAMKGKTTMNKRMMFDLLRWKFYRAAILPMGDDVRKIRIRKALTVAGDFAGAAVIFVLPVFLIYLHYALTGTPMTFGN